MVTWDITRYEQLPDDAWQLDAIANDQDANAKRHGGPSDANELRPTDRPPLFRRRRDVSRARRVRIGRGDRRE